MYSVFSDWTPFSSCTLTCGGGQKTRTRTCTGGTCSLANDDDKTQTAACNEDACPGKFMD